MQGDFALFKKFAQNIFRYPAAAGKSPLSASHRLHSRAAGERAAQLPFLDVPRDHWAYHEILEASVTHTYELVGNGELWN